MEVKIDRLSDTGEGIGIFSNKVVFVPKSVVGDVVVVKNVREYKKYVVSDIDKIIVSGDDRCAVKCPYFDSCGGCQIMNIIYNKQLIYKKNKVINMFKKYGNVNVNPQIVGTSQFNYRNKIVFSVVDGRLGLFKYRSHNVVKVNECLLVLDVINDVVKLINDNIDLSLVKRVMIRASSFNNLMVCFEGEVSNIDILKKYVDSIYVNNVLVFGKSKIVTKLGNYLFEVSNNSFFQVNYEQVIRLYDKVREYLPGFGKVLDLYCGTGTIGIYVSDKCDSVIGIEINEDSVRDARCNKSLNNVKNIDFVCGDVEDVIKDDVYFDSVIVDPPRAGLSSKTKDILLDIGSENIIYVSCDPMTLVRDINYLSSKYEVRDVTLFDMFPNTYHVESVVLLKKK